MRLFFGLGILVSLVGFNGTGAAAEKDWRCFNGLVELSRLSYSLVQDFEGLNAMQLCFVFGQLRQKSASANRDCKLEGMDVSELHSLSEPLVTYCSTSEGSRDTLKTFSKLISDEAERLFNKKLR